MTAEENKAKRFYKIAAVDGSDSIILLDGRSAKTAGRHDLAAPTKTLGDAIAAEWNAQGEFIDRNSMPLTTLLSASIDSFNAGADDPLNDILAFLGTDLVCYRAAEPKALLDRQSSQWDPYIEWLQIAFGARLVATNGIVAVEQPIEAIEAVRAILSDQSPAVLFGIKTGTEITASATLALALWKGAFESSAIFEASRVDENFQEERWGVDVEAEARKERLADNFDAVARFLNYL